MWPDSEVVRTPLSDWIRKTDVFDGVIDSDQAPRDPEHTTGMKQEYNAGDFVHPNEAGYQAMANTIDLGVFTKPSASDPEHR
jgi:lysophospholipase L1-like esterase